MIFVEEKKRKLDHKLISIHSTKYIVWNFYTISTLTYFLKCG